MRILILQDEYLVAPDLELTLRMVRHKILGPAATIGDAYELAEAKKPDLALVDIRLADGDIGLTIARGLWERYRVPSLFVTGHAVDQPGCGEAALGTLAKPVSRTALLHSVEVVRRIMRDEPLTNEDVPADLHLFVSL